MIWYESLRKIGILAFDTLQQLIRMKIFGWLLGFALLVIAGSLLKIPYAEVSDAVGLEELRLLKGMGFGAMTFFSVVFVVSATSLMVSKEVEDRILYAILCKPVFRIEYLVGKYLGVLLALGLGLLGMSFLLACGIESQVFILVQEKKALGEALGWNETMISSEVSTLKELGISQSLGFGVVTIFLKSALIASTALLVSLFSSSALYTLIVSFLIYFIGHYAGDGYEYWVSGSEGDWSRAGAYLLAVICPDFRLFEVMDAVVAGVVFPPILLLSLCGVTVLYICFYLVLSWVIFSRKEF